MSVAGLQASEKLSKATLQKVLASFKAQAKEIKQEIQKVQYLLANPEQRIKWLASEADSQRVNQLKSLLDETEQLYLSSSDDNSDSAILFKLRTEKLLREKLTNLQSYEAEVRIRTAKLQAQVKELTLKGLNDVKKDAALRELYSESHEAGGFYVQTGRAYLNDVVTMETKAAGSKTLGKYMENLFLQYEDGLRDTLVNGMVRGDSYEQMAENLSQSTGVSMRKAKLLVNTESNAIFNSSVSDVIMDNPLVKGYRFRAVLDSHTSEICQSMDGTYIPKEDMKPGVNYPPLHPNCRSTVVTVLVDENEKKDSRQRWTKNDKSQWEKVPPGMTYKQYKERFGFANSSKTPTTYEPPNKSVYGRTFAADTSPVNVGYSKANRSAPERLDALMDLRIGGKEAPVLEKLDADSIVEQALRETGYNNLPTVKTAQAFKDTVNEEDVRYIVFDSEEDKEDYKTGKVSKPVVAVTKDKLDQMGVSTSSKSVAKVTLRNQDRVAKTGADKALTGERDRRYQQYGKEDAQVGKVIYMKYGYDAHDLGNGKTEIFNRTAVVMSDDEPDFSPAEVVPSLSEVKQQVKASKVWTKKDYDVVSSNAYRKDEWSWSDKPDDVANDLQKNDIIARASSTEFADLLYAYTSSDYITMNRAYRSAHKGQIDSYVKQVVDDNIQMLESASTTVKSPLTVSRGTKWSEVDNFLQQIGESPSDRQGASLKALKGRQVTLTNFVESASLEEIPAMSGSIRMKILLPSGSKAVSALGEDSYYDNEHEIQIIGGQKMRIVDFYPETNPRAFSQYVLECVIEPDSLPEAIEEIKKKIK